jgi:hypothetical protein
MKIFWCGPGHGSGTPIDILDKVCKNHDMCYRSVGYHKRSYDKTFLRYVKKIIERWLEHHRKQWQMLSKLG